LGPAIGIGAQNGRRLADAERAQVALNFMRLAEVAFDKHGGAGSAAERFQAIDPGAGKNVKEFPAGDRIPQDAEEGLPDHLWRGAEVLADGADQLAATEGAGDNAEVDAHDLWFIPQTRAGSKKAEAFS